MSLAKPEPWPFDWPPAPGSGVELWLPEVQESAIPAMRERICDERLTTVMSERAQAVAKETGALVYWSDAAASAATIEKDKATVAHIGKLLE